MAGAGAFVSAFVAGSHHAVHMLLLSLGVGGSSFLLGPGARRVMLVVSLAMTALSAWWLLRRPRRGRVETIAVFAAIGASLALLGWSVVRHGW